MPRCIPGCGTHELVCTMRSNVQEPVRLLQPLKGSIMNRPLPLHRAGLRNTAAAVAAALTLAFAANASAQPAGPHHGAHAGLAGQGDFLAGALQRAHDQLNLNSSQQVAWDSAVAAS